MSSWAEIQRLAADLQRVQLGASAKKLSDRNCIEVVQKLISRGLVDLVCSLDAKDYVTRSHLNTQIRNECVANDGRISLTDLSSALNVDYQVVADQCEHIAKTDASRFILAMGQLISRDYLASVCSEVNEMLQENGKLSLASITKTYDLPTELLLNEIRSALGKTISGCMDPSDTGSLVTDAHLHSQRANIAAALLALTRVTPLHRLVDDLNLNANSVFTVYNKLVADGLLQGTIIGGRNVERAVFVPAQYEQRVVETLRSFYEAEEYCDVKLAAQLGLANLYTADSLADALAQQSSHGRPTRLAGTFLVSKSLRERLISNVDNELKECGWVDSSEITTKTLCATADESPPAVIDLDECAAAVTSEVSVRNKGKVDTVDDRWLYNDDLISRLKDGIVPILRQRVADNSEQIVHAIKQSVLQKSAGALDADDAGDKKRGKGKNKGKSNAAKPVSSQSDTLLVFAKDEHALASELRKGCSHAAKLPNEVLVQLSEHLLSPLNSEYRQLAEAACVASTRATVVKGKPGQPMDQDAPEAALAGLVESIRSLHNQIMQFDAGASLFDDDPSISASLRQTLLRSLCVEAANAALLHYTHTAPSLPADLHVPAKRRNELLAGVGDAQAKKAFDVLYACVLQGKKDDLSEFEEAWLSVANSAHICALNLKPPDRRAKQEFIGRYERELAAQLTECTDPASGLLLVCLLHIVRLTSRPIHATGKLVPSLVSKLRSLVASVDKDSMPFDMDELARLQNLVVANFRSKKPAGENEELVSAFESVRSMALRGNNE